MYQPTSRVLTVLELLQSRAQISGAELAERLEVDRRTVRRYIVQLQDLGIPVESERGRYGSYRLLPGFKLPPLMFSEHEALALTLSLLAARQIRLENSHAAAAGAIAKVLRVMPQSLRERVQAVQQTLTVDKNPLVQSAIAPDILTTISLAIQHTRQASLHYQNYSGAVSQRVIDSYGLVCHSAGWYAVGYCHLRADLRTFRLDRVLKIELLESTFSQPAAFNPWYFVERSIATMPRNYQAKILIKATLEEAQAEIPATLGVLTSVEGGVQMVCFVYSLAWLARFLMNLTSPLIIIAPNELREEMQKLQAQITEMLND